MHRVKEFHSDCILRWIEVSGMEVENACPLKCNWGDGPEAEEAISELVTAASASQGQEPIVPDRNPPAAAEDIVTIDDCVEVREIEGW